MEIEFQDLVYAANNNLTSGKVFLNEINYCFKAGNIYAIGGDADFVVGQLITLDKRPTKGAVLINNKAIKKTAKIDNIDSIKKDLVYIDFLAKYKFAKETFLEELTFLLNSKSLHKDIVKYGVDALKMVGLSEDYVNYSLWELSSSEEKKVLLALYLCMNPKVLVLKNVDYGFCEKDLRGIKRLLIKLKRYNKIIVIIGAKVEFLFGLVDKVLIFDNGSLVLEGEKDIFYNNRLYEYMAMPKIVEFILYANKRGHKILNYTDIKELLKGIYRDVSDRR